jgi:hypothetical protein
VLKEEVKMKTYLLKTKKGEVINTTDQLRIEDAIWYFSIVKNITKEELLKIYIVEKDEDWNNN